MVLSVLLQSALLVAFQAGAQIPDPVGLVNDFAHVISAGQVPLIEQMAQDVRGKSKGEITVVTLSDIGQRAVSDVALQIGRQWKVGKIGNPGDPTRNAGAVILIVPKETSSDGHGHCWIATGTGAEGFITDADAGDICREATPFFQQRDYGGGITLITYRVAERFAGEFHFTLDTSLSAPAPVSEAPSRGRGIPPQLIFLGIVFLVLLLSGRRRGGGCFPLFLPFGGGWGGGGGGGWSGGGGGGFGGFGGGGGFSGGGGGSSW
jgi:uncharacterized protein